MEYRYSRGPVSVHLCNDCGAYVGDQARHDDWHAAHSPMPQQAGLGGMGAPFEGGLASAGWMPFPWDMGPPPEAEEFGHLLFTVAQEVFDPRGERLVWSVGSTGRGGPSEMKELGRKFGWRRPDDTGEGMVYVAVGNIPARDRLPCGQYDNPGPSGCRTETMPDGSPAQVLTNHDRLEVHWSRPDGSYVFAIVDATFRNNSLTPTSAPLPTLDQLVAFVMDPRLVLP